MRVLNKEELHQVSGGVWNFIGGAAAGLVQYGVYNYRHDKAATLSGAITAMAFGAVTSGFGSFGITACGGGIIGNLIWRPKIMAANSIGQAIAANYSEDKPEGN
ncbi:MAG: class IIb bacteriocin, lactobin A/cerein 7B family [Pseudomonadota bacterium]